MKKRLLPALTLVAVVLPAGASQASAEPPIASKPVVELKGKIASVHVGRGQCMPYLMVEHDGQTTHVQLGSMRYLMDQGFQPKAGDEIAVKGYRLDDEVVAATVWLGAARKELRLRDDHGWPLWRRGGGRSGPPSATPAGDLPRCRMNP